MVKKIYYIVLPLVLILFFIIRFVIPQLSKDSRCITYKEFLKISSDGAVLKKYIDSSQHSFPTIEIKDIKDFEIEKLNLALDTSGIYNKINVNDTLSKETGKEEVFVIKGKKKILLAKIDFGCKSN